jgi:3-methyladenine DNA glycosylase AlkD
MAKVIKASTLQSRKKSPASENGAVTAKAFIEELHKLQSDVELKKIQRYFKANGSNAQDKFIGIRMASLFALSKKFVGMSPTEIEKLLESSVHEVRAGALSIMNYQGREKKTTDARRKELYDLYIRRHDRINNWDLVDLAAAHVVGRYLDDRPRAILYKLAKSKNMWERRTAIVSTWYFIRQNDIEDTFKIGDILAHDEEDLVQKATGGWIREAGKRDVKRLKAFLDKHAATMPRVALRYTIEKLPRKDRDHYLSLKKINRYA